MMTEHFPNAQADGDNADNEWLPLSEVAWRLGTTRRRVEEYASHLATEDRWHPEDMTFLQSIVDYPSQLRVRFAAMQMLHYETMQTMEQQAESISMTEPTLDPKVELATLEKELTHLEDIRVALSKEIDAVAYRHTSTGERRAIGNDRRNGRDRRTEEGRRGEAGRRTTGKDRRLARAARLASLSAQLTQLLETIEILERRRQNLMELTGTTKRSASL